MTVVAGAVFGDEGAGAEAGAAGRVAGLAGWAALDDLLAEAFAAGVADEAFFTAELGELEETTTACAVEDVPATDIEAGALGEDVFGAAAIVPFTGAEVLTATALALLGCANGGLPGAGAAAGATARVETALTFETASACAVEDVPTTDPEAGALGEDAFGVAAIALFTGAEVFTATELALLGCADGGLLGAGRAAGATATVETTLALETATGLDTASEATELGRAGTGVTTATAGAGFSTGFVTRLAASCCSVAGC